MMKPRVSRALSVILALAVGVLLSGCGLAQSIQDRLDRMQLQRHFGVPRGAQLVSYEGYPSLVGFGQREGLHISAVYHLTDEQESAFMEASLEGDWVSLPIPVAERDRIRSYSGDVPLDIEQGIYLTRTAGSYVMRARETTAVTEAAALADLILGVLDSRTNRLHVRISSGY